MREVWELCDGYVTGKREEGGRGAPTRRPNQARGTAQRSEGGRPRRPCATEARGMRGEERAHRGGSAHPSGAEQHKRGATHPPPDSDRRERRGGGTGGRGQGARPTREGGTRQHDSGRSAPSRSEGEEISARARDARTRWTSGPISERRGARRPVASHPNKEAPRLWREELTRGDTQRQLIRKGGAKRSPQRVGSRAPTGGRREAGRLNRDENQVIS